MNDTPQKPSADDAYAVGYGKPPKAGQFKKGNKIGKGRPKGAKSMKTLYAQAFEAKVTAKINGTVKKITKAELAMHQLANKASAGDLKAIDKVLELLARYGPIEEGEMISADQAAYDLETIRHHLIMNGKLQEENDESSS